MLSEEEIEYMKEDLINLHHMLGKKPSISTNAIENALEYMNQLETELKEVTMQRNELATELSDKEDDKQKLIEKLEEDLNDLGEQTKDNYLREKANYTIKYLSKYRKILKGEKNESTKRRML